VRRQQQTDLNTAHEKEGKIDYNYQFSQKVFVGSNGILHKAESRYLKEHPGQLHQSIQMEQSGFNAETIMKG
jgi:hypothetical protein